LGNFVGIMVARGLPRGGVGAWKSGYKDTDESNMWELLGGAETAEWMERCWYGAEGIVLK